ncbi:MAG TPA: DNRLRE domain-containing protein [Anaerolineales bacterium]|nr:DNRLRE domain-containing protein [Anaerolineales bacterium]
MTRKIYSITRALLILVLWGLTINFSAGAHPHADGTVYLPLIFNRYGGFDGLRIVNATRFNARIATQGMAIFWFGQVNSVENYADVRVGYNADQLEVDINIFDRYLWYDTDPSVDTLTEWDAITLFLSASDLPGDVPTPTEYKLVAQLNHWQDRQAYQAFYQGNGETWSQVSLPITTTRDWRGNGFNDRVSDKGWGMRYTIPFSALGFSAPPDDDIWRVAVLLYDRDNAENTPIDDKFWPETFQPLDPRTWGALHFGEADFTPSDLTPTGSAIIKQGINGALVPDAHVGGAFNCGADVDHWNEWGYTNYENIDPTQINIQNQDEMLADWPCFSKYFVTFPLDAIPAGSTVVSATLTLYQFGNSGMGWEPPPVHSWIQVLTIADEWTDTTITWNNAPLAAENITMTRVEPLSEYPGWPGIPITWNISKAVVDAYMAGEPLQLALYSADSAMHSGKYFHASESGGDDTSARPTLTVYWAQP